MHVLQNTEAPKCPSLSQLRVLRGRHGPSLPLYWKLRGSEQPPTFSAFLAVCNCEWLIRVHDVYIRGNNSVATAVEVPSCQASSSPCGS